MKENRRKKKHVFKEIIFKNNNYYLKCDNYSIKDQLSWSDFKYPKNNEITNKLSSILILIICILFFVIFLQIFNLDNDKNFEYFFHLIDLGYEQENKKYFEKSKNLNSDFKNYIILYCIIIGIILILTIAKWTFFGGFKNIIFIWLSIFIYIIICLLNLAVIVLSVYGAVFNIIALVKYNNVKIEFSRDSIYRQFLIYFIVYFYVLLLVIIEFIFVASKLFLFCSK